MEIGAILAQSRPANTTAVSAYSPGASVRTKITRILVCNTTGNTPTFRIFLDNDGTTYNQTTALYYDKAMSANDTTTIEGDWWMDNSSGNLAVRTSAGNELTFTIFGIEDHI